MLFLVCCFATELVDLFDFHFGSPYNASNQKALPHTVIPLPSRMIGTSLRAKTSITLIVTFKRHA